MQKRKIALLLILVFAISLLSGCVTRQAGAAAEVDALISAREKSVNAADTQGYLATVLPSDTVLQKEEANLVRAAGSIGIKDYTVTARDICKTDSGCTAALTQAYTIGNERHTCAYTAAFVIENGKLYYDGPAFNLKQNDWVRVYFSTDREALAGQVLDAETDILNRMREQLGFTPSGAVSVKLFENQAVFLQSIKLDLPQWVGGWHEYGEAVKTFVGAYGPDVEPYKAMLCHESTHLMVSELSNDNAAYWLQEGLAGLYEDQLLGVKSPSPEEASTVTPYTEQKSINLEKLGVSDQQAVLRYYASAKAYAEFLTEQYGWEKVREALEYMKKYELIPVTSAEKLDTANARTDEALINVFGFNGDAALQSAFDKWMANKK